MNTDPFNLRKPIVTNPFNVKVDNSIKDSVEAIIRTNPNWLVYVRCDHRYPCPQCFDPVTKSPDNTCRMCFGLGYSVQYEKHPTRKVVGAKTIDQNMTSAGYLAQFETVVYTPTEYFPKSKDIYIETEWSVDWEYIKFFGKPTNIIQIYQISESMAYAENEISFFASACDTYDFDLVTLNEWVKNIGPNWSNIT